MTGLDILISVFFVSVVVMWYALSRASDLQKSIRDAEFEKAKLRYKIDENNIYKKLADEKAVYSHEKRLKQSIGKYHRMYAEVYTSKLTGQMFTYYPNIGEMETTICGAITRYKGKPDETLDRIGYL